jgi:hypothetical protein
MNTGRAFLAIALAVLIVTGGLGLNAGMGMSMDTGASGCPFMGMTAFCEMTPLAHLSAWQTLSAYLPQQKDIGALALLLLVLASALVGIGSALALPRPAVQRIRIRDLALLPPRPILRTLSLLEHSPTLA